jgi:hypothetical protein
MRSAALMLTGLRRDGLHFVAGDKANGLDIFGQIG